MQSLSITSHCISLHFLYFNHTRPLVRYLVFNYRSQPFTGSISSWNQFCDSEQTLIKIGEKSYKTLVWVAIISWNFYVSWNYTYLSVCTGFQYNMYFLLWVSSLKVWQSLRYTNVTGLSLCLFTFFQPSSLSLIPHFILQYLALIPSSCSTNTCLIKNNS